MDRHSGRDLGSLEAKDERPEIIVDDCLDAELPSRWHQQEHRCGRFRAPVRPARTIESRITGSGLPLFSNASSHRMHPDVPLVIADLDLSPMERFGHGDLGPNGLLHELHRHPRGAPRSRRSWRQANSHRSPSRPNKRSREVGSDFFESISTIKEVGHPIPGEAEKIEEEFRRLTMVRGVDLDRCRHETNR